MAGKAKGRGGRSGQSSKKVGKEGIAASGSGFRSRSASSPSVSLSAAVGTNQTDPIALSGSSSNTVPIHPKTLAVSPSS
jgi:hypothetical protein